MAEMLVDSTKLDACLDAEADAIRAKTGGSADIPFDFANSKGFADAITAIPSGGGSGTLDGITDVIVQGIDLTTSNIVDHKLLIDLTGKKVRTTASMFRTGNTDSLLEVTLKCESLTATVGPMFQIGSPSAYNAKSITIISNQDYITPVGNITGGSSNAKGFKEFYGVPFYVTSFTTTASGHFGRAAFVTHFSLWENVATGVMTLNAQTGLDDYTLVQVANALKDGTTNTVTFHATPKARLSTIMGYVESVTRGEGETLETYNRFVADENGTVTLTDFITNTKGWTVA